MQLVSRRFLHLLHPYLTTETSGLLSGSWCAHSLHRREPVVVIGEAVRRLRRVLRIVPALRVGMPRGTLRVAFWRHGVLGDAVPRKAWNAQAARRKTPSIKPV